MRKKLKILDVAQSLGIKVNSSGKALCPLHDDHDPSMVFYPRTDTFFCFGCSVSGNIYELVKRVVDTDYDGAREWLLQNGYEVPNFMIIRDANIDISRPVVPTLQDRKIYDSLYQNLTLDQKGKKYLKSRGFSQEIIDSYHFKSLTNPKKQAKKLKEKFTIKQLMHAGLMNKSKNGNEYFAFWKPAILVFFVWDDIYYIQSRNYGNSPKTTNLCRISRPLYNLKTLAENEKIFITESVFDTLSLIQCGFPSIALLGTSLNSHYLPFFKGKEVVLSLDFDQAGRKAKQKLQVQIKNYARKLYSVTKSSLFAKDMNETLQG